MQWYYALNGDRKGPVSDAGFAQLVPEGIIKPDTLVWHEGMANWLPYAQVATGPAAGAAGAPPATGAGDDTAVCVVSGKVFPKREMMQYEGQWISAEHREEFFQRLREGVGLGGKLVYAGFGVRVGARLLDSIILILVTIPINMLCAYLLMGTVNYFRPPPGTVTTPYSVVSFILGLSLGITYEVAFIRRRNATPGKMALGLQVVRADGASLSVGRIIGRHFAEMLSGFMLGIGYLMVGFDSAEHRGLHDRICDTRVIKKTR